MHKLVDAAYFATQVGPFFSQTYINIEQVLVLEIYLIGKHNLSKQETFCTKHVIPLMIEAVVLCSVWLFLYATYFPQPSSSSPRTIMI